MIVCGWKVSLIIVFSCLSAQCFGFTSPALISVIRWGCLMCSFHLWSETENVFDRTLWKEEYTSVCCFDRSQSSVDVCDCLLRKAKKGRYGDYIKAEDPEHEMKITFSAFSARDLRSSQQEEYFARKHVVLSQNSSEPCHFLLEFSTLCGPLWMVLFDSFLGGYERLMQQKHLQQFLNDSCKSAAEQLWEASLDCCAPIKQTVKHGVTALWVISPLPQQSQSTFLSRLFCKDTAFFFFFLTAHVLLTFTIHISYSKVLCCTDVCVVLLRVCFLVVVFFVFFNRVCVCACMLRRLLSLFITEHIKADTEEH